jgi:hypothetical protein
MLSQVAFARQERRGWSSRARSEDGLHQPSPVHENQVVQRYLAIGFLTLFAVGAMLGAAEAMATEYYPRPPREVPTISCTIGIPHPIPWPREFRPRQAEAGR